MKAAEETTKENTPGRAMGGKRDQGHEESDARIVMQREENNSQAEPTKTPSRGTGAQLRPGALTTGFRQS
jgi:hypothetical protein